MSGRNFSLTPRLSGFIDKAVKNGRHQNASEVVREALRRYEDDIKAEDASNAAIWAIAERGIADMERGDFITIKGEEDARELFAELNREAVELAAASKREGKMIRRRG